MSDPIRTFKSGGYTVNVDDRLGHLSVDHFGHITWDELMAIKDEAWGTEARAIEVYPRRKALINNAPCRHLWRLGETDFCPDLLGPGPDADSLQARYSAVWAEAAP